MSQWLINNSRIQSHDGEYCSNTSALLYPPLHMSMVLQNATSVTLIQLLVNSCWKAPAVTCWTATWFFKCYCSHFQKLYVLTSTRLIQSGGSIIQRFSLSVAMSSNSGAFLQCIALSRTWPTTVASATLFKSFHKRFPLGELFRWFNVDQLVVLCVVWIHSYDDQIWGNFVKWEGGFSIP